MSETLIPEDLVRVEATLRNEIEKFVRSGYRWAPDVGPTYAGGRWVSNEFDDRTGKLLKCGCAISALLVNRQPPPNAAFTLPHSIRAKRETAAAELGVPHNWLEDFYYAVASDGACFAHLDDDSQLLVKRIQDFGWAIDREVHGARRLL